jgi:hypothetical protein
MTNLDGTVVVPQCVIDSIVYQTMLKNADGDRFAFLQHVPQSAKLWESHDALSIVRWFDYWGCTYVDSSILIDRPVAEIDSLVAEFGADNVLVDKFMSINRIHGPVSIDMLDCIDKIIQTNQYDVFNVILAKLASDITTCDTIMQRIAMYADGKLAQTAIDWIISHAVERCRSDIEGSMSEYMSIALEMDNVEFVMQIPYMWTKDDLETAVKFISIRCIKYVFDKIKHSIYWMSLPDIYEYVYELYDTKPIEDRYQEFVYDTHKLELKFHGRKATVLPYQHRMSPENINHDHRYEVFKFLIEKGYQVSFYEVYKYIIPSGCARSLALVIHKFSLEEQTRFIYHKRSTSVPILNCIRATIGTGAMLESFHCILSTHSIAEYMCSIGYVPSINDVDGACVGGRQDQLRILLKYLPGPPYVDMTYTKYNVNIMQLIHENGGKFTGIICELILEKMNLDCINYMHRHAREFVSSIRFTNRVDVTKITLDKIIHCHGLGFKLSRILCVIAVITKQLDLLKYLTDHGIKSSKAHALAVKKNMDEFVECMQINHERGA